MAIEAALSKFKKTNLKIYIIACIVVVIWLAYDGYFNEKFRERHTDSNGKPDSTLVFNQKAPPVFIGAAVLLAAYFFAVRNRKLIAGENELVIANKERISYNSIERIDKSHFKSKGFFILTYKNDDGRDVNRKLSNKGYDNLAAVLDKLVAEISK